MKKIILATIIALLNNGYQVADSKNIIEQKPKTKITQKCIITAYTEAEDECGKNDGITASGTKVKEGRTVAADHLPFGTIIKIDGKEYTVEDRFGAGYKNKIDIYMSTKEKCYNFGKKEMEIEIIKNKK